MLGVPALAAVWFGRPWFDLLVVAGAGVLAWEWGLVLAVPFVPGGLLALVATGAALAAAALGGGMVPALALAAGGMLLVAAAVRVLGGERPLWQAAGVPYVALPALALTWLRSDAPDGRLLVIWVFLVVWATDVGAYAAGRGIGGVRLAPRLSPKKTWAGLAGGVAAGAAAGAAVFALLPGGAAPGPGAAAAALLAVAAQGGDLLESVIKRRFERKDSSALIPGHGGLFDRVDGLLVAAPLAALVWAITAVGSG